MAKNNHRLIKPLGLRASAIAVASSLALFATPMAAQAAGLGKVVVFSALGQPLRAEIELTASREELSGMKAQLASRESFKQAGLDYATTLLGISFSLDKRPNGQSVIKLTSTSPINDPFVDMLLELNWPTGRLVREYTFLLDPPEIAAKNAQVAVSPVTTKPQVSVASMPAAPRTASPIGEDTRARAQARARGEEPATPMPVAKTAEKPAEKSADKPTEGGDSREVKRGDTLSKIASATKPEGVSLEQMLVGLLRANQEAFDGGNMNRLKSGKILTIPDKATLEAVTPAEAKKVVMAQSADWNAYRGKLAAIAAQSPASESAAKQESAGKITAKVEDKVAPVSEAKDQLKVSKSEQGAAKAGAAVGKRSDEDLIAKEKALKDANERAATLEKNVANLQKLLELKEQNLAELQKQANAKTKSAEAPKPVEPPKPIEPPKPVVAPKSVEPPKPAEPPKPVEPPKPAEPVPAPMPVPAPAPAVAEKPAEPVPAPKPEDMPKPKPKPVAPPPPPPEPSFLDELLDNPLALAGGGGVLALLGAYFAIRRRRAGKEEVPLDVTSTLSPVTSNMTANSVFRSTGGQSVDTSHTPPQTDFSQAGPGSIDTDEVDPVAEADVYMAYGRDAQAEEILLEAKQKDAKRYAIHLKLLEIYSNRKDVKQFETLATELYGETSGIGSDWEKAAAMGLRLDPVNPLYGGSGQATDTPFDADATVIVAAQSVRNTVTLPGELSQIADGAEKTEAPVDASSAPLDLASLDFDLGLGDAKPVVEETPAGQVMDETVKLSEPVVDNAPLDFDLAAPVAAEAGAEAPVEDQPVGALDFNLPDLHLEAAPEPVASKEIPDLDFDLGFDAASPASTVEVEVSAPAPQELSVSGLSFAPASAFEVPAAPVDDNDLEFDVNLTASTFLGRPEPELESEPDLALDPLPEAEPVAAPFDMKAIDLDLDVAEPVAIEAAPEVPASDVATPADSLPFESAQVSTSVNADFLTAQAETVVNPQFGAETELAAPDFDINANEEVATKLDLAKAYEEMGDLEGARELLQEVVKEGDFAQREKAQAILAKIGA